MRDGQVLILFECDSTELRMALETLYMVRDVTGTDVLDPAITDITNILTPPPAVMHICERCWQPIDPRVHLSHSLDGKYIHEKCPN